MLCNQPIKSSTKESSLTHFEFIKNNLRYITELHESFKINRNPISFRTELAIGSIQDIWGEFINEPFVALDLSLFKRSRSAAAYALLTLYAHMSKS